MFVGDNIYVVSLFCTSLCWEMYEELSMETAIVMPKISEYIVEYWIATSVRVIVPISLSCSSEGRKLKT